MSNKNFTNGIKLNSKKVNQARNKQVKIPADIYIVLMTKYPDLGGTSEVALTTRNYAKAFNLMKSLKRKPNTTAQVVVSSIQ